MTLVAGSYTSSLRSTRFFLPLCAQPRRRGGRNPRKLCNPVRGNKFLCPFHAYRPWLFSLPSDPWVSNQSSTATHSAVAKLSQSQFSLDKLPLFIYLFPSGSLDFSLMPPVFFLQSFCMSQQDPLALYRLVVWWSRWERVPIYTLEGYFGARHPSYRVTLAWNGVVSARPGSSHYAVTWPLTLPPPLTP